MPYEKAAGRIEELCSTLSPDVAVPACPGWTTAKLMAHLAGLTEDWVAGDLDPYASPEWTSRQVARLTGRSLGDLVEAWRQARRSFAELPESAGDGRSGDVGAR